jgi:uncharacterized membrane protein YgaE (UPF0421/DUF939 family)
MRIVAATVLAYVLADLLPSVEPPVVAALTALLVVEMTFYQTVRNSWQRIGSVVAGVLVAVLLSAWVGLTWWSLGLTVLASLLVGQRLRLGAHAVEVPISAMLVLAVAGHTEVGVARVYETLVGAAAGVLVSLLAPPVYVQPAGDAIGDLAGQIARLLRSVAAELEQDWTYERAARGLDRARELEHTIRDARAALTRAEESLRLNPRGRGAEHVPQTLRSALTALEYAAINLRVACRALVDRVKGVPEHEMPGPEVRRPLARLLEAAADAVDGFGDVVAPDVAGPTRSDDRLREALQRARSLRDAATRAMVVDAQTQPDLWRVHGALLAHIDRLLNEIDPEATLARHAVNRPTNIPSQGARLSMLRRRVRAREVSQRGSRG